MDIGERSVADRDLGEKEGVQSFFFRVMKHSVGYYNGG